MDFLVVYLCIILYQFPANCKSVFSKLYAFLNFANTGTVYDVTRRDTFTNLSDIWAKEIDLYSTNQDCIKMLVGNKVDKVFQASQFMLLTCSAYGLDL